MFTLPAIAILFRIIDHHARHGLYPGNMASNGLDARNVFSCDDCGFTLMRSQNNAPQIHDTVTNRGIEWRRPRLFCQFGH